MKAMVLREFGTLLSFEEVPDPIPSAEEVLLKVRACGVCLTDIKILHGQIPATRLPHIMGHEISGDVVSVGNLVKAVKTGDRCAVYGYITCGNCVYCLGGRENQCIHLLKREGLGRVGLDKPGGYAEYVKVPACNVCLIPEGVSYEAACIAADAIATPYHAIKANSVIDSTARVMTIGAGGLGIHGAQLAKHFGGEVLTLDVEDRKLAAVKKLGIDRYANPTRDDITAIVREWTHGLGCDIVFDFTGKAVTTDLAMKCVKNVGQIVIVGYTIGENFTHPIQQLISREISIMGCRASTLSDLRESLSLLADGIVQPFVDKIFPLEQANTVLKELKEKGFLGRSILRV
jgi:propanol-preferring alcohol dehydrogenase